MDRQMNGKQVEGDKGWIEGRRRGVTHIAESRVFIEKYPNWQELGKSTALHWYPATCPSTPFFLSFTVPAIFHLPVFFRGHPFCLDSLLSHNNTRDQHPCVCLVSHFHSFVLSLTSFLLVQTPPSLSKPFRYGVL